jgi:hypothetical protein
VVLPAATSVRLANPETRQRFDYPAVQTHVDNDYGRRVGENIMIDDQPVRAPNDPASGQSLSAITPMTLATYL